MNKISVNQLELLFKLVINKLREEKAEDFTFDMDYYWIVLPDEWANFKDDFSPSLSVGSLMDDIRYLNKAVEEDANILILILTAWRAFCGRLAKKWYLQAIMLSKCIAPLGSPLFGGKRRYK